MKSSTFSGDIAENSIMQTISIAVSAILIAAGLITAPSLINNARDTNVKNDLANMAHVQEWNMSNAGTYGYMSTHVERNSAVKLTLSDDEAEIVMALGPTSTCYVELMKSKSGKTFYRISDGTVIKEIVGVWPTSAPAGFPSACTWPKNPYILPTATGNLAAGPIMALGTVAITPGVTYGGDAWTRVVAGSESNGIRQYVDLATITGGQSYTAQWEVANDGPTPITVVTDWSDTGYFKYHLDPGERRTITSNGILNTYTAMHRFTDIWISNVGGSGLLFRQIIVKPSV